MILIIVNFICYLFHSTFLNNFNCIEFLRWVVQCTPHLAVSTLAHLADEFEVLDVS